MKFANGPFVQPVSAIEPAQGAPGQLETTLVDPIELAVQAQQFATNLRIARNQFKGAFQLPDRFRKCPLLIIDNAQPHPGHQILWICSQRSLKELDSLAVHLLFQAGLSQQAIGLNMFGIGTKDMLAMGNGFIQSNAAN